MKNPILHLTKREFKALKECSRGGGGYFDEFSEKHTIYRRLINKGLIKIIKLSSKETKDMYEKEITSLWVCITKSVASKNIRSIESYVSDLIDIFEADTFVVTCLGEAILKGSRTIDVKIAR